MKSVDPGTDFKSWRKVARSLLENNIPPASVIWESGDGLFSSAVAEEISTAPRIAVPAEFVRLAETACCHTDPTRWALLYRILWRLTRGGERDLLAIASDPDVAKVQTFAKNVRREIHKMHAFVRFKLIATDENGRERYAAWFEPDYFSVAPSAPFFRERFANMDWSIFTPKGCAHWIGGEFSLAPGISRNPVEDPDQLEAAWGTYYRSIFNPARLKVKMMKSEMPRRYWKNLPEAAHIDELIAGSRYRTARMLDSETHLPKPAPKLPYLENLNALSREAPVFDLPPPDTSLPELKRLSENCRACPLWENATCTVFGEGPESAKIMIVGEQPGDREDVAGRPFVGPAGKLLDRALAEAGIQRSDAYLTNAVKHFKWTPRGKVRLHQKPAAGEIDACRPWLLGELKNIRPQILILLGATAARSVLGKSVSITRQRGLIELPAIAPRVILTVHPSYLLRLPDPAAKEAEYRKFIDDLRLTGSFQSGSPTA